MKHLLVATDLSSRSDRAVRRAFSLAKQLGLQTTLVSVVDSALPKDIAAKLQADITESLQNTVATHGDPTTTQIEVPIGDVVVEIGRLAKKTSADLIVLGLHRKRSFMEGLRQTTMERIVALSSGSVLLVTEPAENTYKSVLIPISYSPACSNAVKVAHKVAPTAEFTSFHALHVPFQGLTGGEDSEMEHAVRQESEAQGEAWRRAFNVSQDLPKIVIGGPAAVLYQKIQKAKPDLIAIGAHTRSGLTLHKIGAFASELVRDPPTDLLIAKA